MLPLIVILKVHKSLYFVTSLLLARNFLLASLFSFQGADLSDLFQAQIETLRICKMLQSNLGGDKRDRTADLLNAIQALSQLSYTPISIFQLVGPSGLEPPTSRLSVVRSSQLSYGPSSSRTAHRSFPPCGENSLTPSLRLFLVNPLRWASLGALGRVLRAPSKLNNVTTYRRPY